LSDPHGGISRRPIRSTRWSAHFDEVLDRRRCLSVSWNAHPGHYSWRPRAAPQPRRQTPSPPDPPVFRPPGDATTKSDPAVSQHEQAFPPSCPSVPNSVDSGQRPPISARPCLRNCAGTADTAMNDACDWNAGQAPHPRAMKRYEQSGQVGRGLGVRYATAACARPPGVHQTLLFGPRRFSSRALAAMGI
jgi:hypothetical protein